MLRRSIQVLLSLCAYVSVIRAGFHSPGSSDKGVRVRRQPGRLKRQDRSMDEHSNSFSRPPKDTYAAHIVALRGARGDASRVTRRGIARQSRREGTKFRARLRWSSVPLEDAHAPPRGGPQPGVRCEQHPLHLQRRRRMCAPHLITVKRGRRADCALQAPWSMLTPSSPTTRSAAHWLALQGKFSLLSSTSHLSPLGQPRSVLYGGERRYQVSGRL